MRENHGVIYKERIVFVFPEKLLDEINANIRTKLTISKLLVFSVDGQIRTGVATIVTLPVNLMAISLLQLPEAGLIKTKMRRSFIAIPQLPLSRDAGLVSRIAKVIPEGFLIMIEVAKLGVIPNVEFPRHQLHPRRSANRIGKGIGETHPALCHLINIWCLVVLTPIRPHRFIAHVIGHDHDDVGFHTQGATNREGNKQTSKTNTHHPSTMINRSSRTRIFP